MKTRLLILISILFTGCALQAQPLSYRQYFDGQDTGTNSFRITPDADSGNIWQIGPPQKSVFNRAMSVPNVLVTDTLNPYPANDTSRFGFRVPRLGTWGANTIIAVRWMQKLDMEKGHSGGVIEFSKNGGPWQNIFNNPGVYNLYGFRQENKDTLADSTYAFSGTDTTWRDIWFCLRREQPTDTIDVRFTFISDSSSRRGEGWMLDNFRAQQTIFHTIAQVMTEADSRVYPTQTTGILHIEASALPQRHEIQSVQIVNMHGQVVRRYNDVQSRYMIDIGDCAPGKYAVQVVSNLGKETFSVMLQR